MPTHVGTPGVSQRNKNPPRGLKNNMTLTEENALFWQTGHFRNPAYPDLWNVTKVQALALTEADPIRRQVVQSYQEFSRRQLSQLTWIAHGREAYCDGDSGPATAVVVAQPRCAMPDYHVPDDPELEPLWAKEEANWPDACRRELLIGRAFDALPGLSRADTDKVYHAIANNWTAAFQDIDMAPRNDQRTREGLRLFQRLEAMGNGTLAYNYLARNRCDDWLDGAWNSKVTWSLDLACPTGSHEHGHGLGLNHVDDSTALMYYAITSHSRARYGYPNATDIRAAEALGYKPYSNWEARKPTADRLFVPRTAPDPIPPGPPPEPPTDGVFTWPSNGMPMLDGVPFEQRIGSRTAVLVEKASV